MGMTSEDALKLAPIIAAADGWCGTCSREQVKWLEREFPKFAWRALVDEAEDRHKRETQEFPGALWKERPDPTRPLVGPETTA